MHQHAQSIGGLGAMAASQGHQGRLRRRIDEIIERHAIGIGHLLWPGGASPV